MKWLKTKTRASLNEIPNGLCIKTQDGYFYVSNNQRFRFISPRAFDSWSTKAYECDEEALNMPVSGRVGFRNGTWVRSFVSNAVYLIADNQKRLISNPDVLQNFNVSTNDILMLSKDELLFHKDGVPIG